MDRYLAWLLEQKGVRIPDLAPVVALCSNIVKDTSGVAELKPSTRQAFRSAVEATLDAFRKGSGVPPQNQLEILEALGQLGVAVKQHLIDATKAGLFQVRRRAIEMLLPHLSENELFCLGHILEDRSKESIKTYLLALLERNPHRTAALLQKKSRFDNKVTEAIAEITSSFRHKLSNDEWFELLCVVCERSSLWGGYVSPWISLVESLILTAYEGGNKSQTLQRIRSITTNAVSYGARSAMLKAMAEKWPDEATRDFLKTRAVEDTENGFRGAAFFVLGKLHSKFG